MLRETAVSGVVGQHVGHSASRRFNGSDPEHGTSRHELNFKAVLEFDVPNGRRADELRQQFSRVRQCNNTALWKGRLGRSRHSVPSHIMITALNFRFVVALYISLVQELVVKRRQQ